MIFYRGVGRTFHYRRCNVKENIRTGTTPFRLNGDSETSLSLSRNYKCGKHVNKRQPDHKQALILIERLYQAHNYWPPSWFLSN